MKKLADIQHPVGSQSWIVEGLQLLEQLIADLIAAKAEKAPANPPETVNQKALDSLDKRISAIETAAKAPKPAAPAVEAPKPPPAEPPAKT
jgi:hypothetical protein